MVEVVSETIILDYNNICRVCLSPENDLLSLFKKHVWGEAELSLHEILKECSSVEIEEGDGYPEHICKMCYKKLDVAYRLRQTCQRSDEILRNQLSENEIYLEEDNVPDSSTESLTQIEGSLNDKKSICFVNLSNLSTNKTDSVKKYEIVCAECDKTFTNTNELIEHVNLIHTVNKVVAKYLCAICDDKFMSKRSLRHHVSLHTDTTANNLATSLDKKYSCEICAQKFSFRCNLRRHMLQHTGEKPHRCKFCNKGFTQLCNLENHIRVHTGEHPFTCKCCGKLFKRKAALKVHMLEHTGVKPFSCNVCLRRFTQVGHLNYHMRIHSGEKPYSCQVCGKTFALNSNLRVHSRIHTGETPFVCSVCNRGFHDSSSLKKHAKVHK